MGGGDGEKGEETVAIGMHGVCISTGLAAALDASLKPGDVVVARTAETLDQKLRIESDSALVDFAVACGARAVNIPLTSEKTVATPNHNPHLTLTASIRPTEST